MVKRYLLTAASLFLAALPVAADPRGDVLRWLEVGRLDRAERDLMYAVPRLTRAEAALLSALIDVRAHRQDAAAHRIEEGFEAGIERTPALLFVLGWLRLAGGDAEGAVEPLEEAVRTTGSWAADAVLGQARLEIGDAAAAVEALRRAALGCRHDVSRSVILHDLAIAHIRSGEYDDAERTLREALATAAPNSHHRGAAERLLAVLRPVRDAYAGAAGEER